jgi:hypothetical protein
VDLAADLIPSIIVEANVYEDDVQLTGAREVKTGCAPVPDLHPVPITRQCHSAQLSQGRSPRGCPGVHTSRWRASYPSRRPYTGLTGSAAWGMSRFTLRAAWKRASTSFQFQVCQTAWKNAVFWFLYWR